MNERIIHEAEEIGAIHVRKQVEDNIEFIELYMDGGLLIKDAFELVKDTNGWIGWIAGGQIEVYDLFRYRFFATDGGYRIIRADEELPEGLEINVNEKIG